MAPVSLHPLELADVAVVLGLLESGGLPTVGIKENPGAFVVARIGEEIVGCGGVEIHGNDGLLRSIAVEPQHRKRGIANAIVEHLLGLPQHAGLASTYLLTTTASDFFPRFGFDLCPRGEAPEAIRASWEFRTGCPDTAVFMRRHVDTALLERDVRAASDPDLRSALELGNPSSR
jgi:amino-acid N-acetyltransferase